MTRQRVYVPAMMILLFAAGCGGAASARPGAAPAEPQGRLLFDAHTGCGQRSHFTLVDDPFGGATKAGKGDAGARGRQKMVLLNEKGFFPMPADREGKAVVIRLGVRGSRDVRVMLVSGEEHGTYLRTLPAEGRWCDLELPLSEAPAVATGGRIVDITIWQMAADPGGVLYVQKAWLVTRPRQ